jgi:hypothetical protein
VVGTGDGLQGNRASGVGSPHVAFGRGLAKVDELGEVGGSEGEQEDRDGNTCTEATSLSLKARIVSVVRCKRKVATNSCQTRSSRQDTCVAARSTRAGGNA